MQRHHRQQVLRRVDDKGLDEKVKVDLPLLSRHASQRRRNGLHDKRPDQSLRNVVPDGEHERPAGHIWGEVRMWEIKREELTP